MEKHGAGRPRGWGQPEDMGQPESDELGAHVSSSGGVQRAPARAEEIESAVLQLFTNSPPGGPSPRPPLRAGTPSGPSGAGHESLPRSPTTRI